MPNKRDNAKRWRPWLLILMALLVLIALNAVVETLRSPPDSEHDPSTTTRTEADALIAEADALENKQGSQRVRRDMVEQALKNYEELHADQDDPEITAELAVIRFRLGKLVELLESPREAIYWYEQARGLQEELIEEHPSDSDVRPALADTLSRIGSAQARLGELDTAMDTLIQAKTLREDLMGETADDAEYQRKMANSYMNIGIVEMCNDNFDAAEAQFRLARDIRTKLGKSDDVQFDIAKGHYNLGQLQLFKGDAEAAVLTLEGAAQLFKQLVPKDSAPERNYLLALCITQLAMAQLESAIDDRDNTAAMTTLDRARGLAKQLVHLNPDVPKYQELLDDMQNLSTVNI